MWKENLLNNPRTIHDAISIENQKPTRKGKQRMYQPSGTYPAAWCCISTIVAYALLATDAFCTNKPVIASVLTMPFAVKKDS